MYTICVITYNNFNIDVKRQANFYIIYYMRMNTSAKGDISEAFALHKFLTKGWGVSVPFGDNLRYDMIIDIDGKLYKIQVKTGTFKDGKISFKTSSTEATTKKNVGYHGQIDYFACVCDGNVYLVPIGICGVSYLYLRVDPPKNGQTIGINWAKDYLI